MWKLLVKKGVIALLIVAALLVLITPGIIGRLAEESIDQNLEMAVTENDDVVVSSLGFVRGWFTSEGQHRIELRDRAALADPDDADDETRYAEALIVTTRIDHGLIPLTSMAREEGSLAPGLGSAVSTISVEVSDGTSFDIPGAIYSEVGLTGELQSNFLLEADNLNAEGRLFDWGAVDLLVTSNPATGALSVKGEIDAASVSSPQETISIGRITIDSEQVPGPFGYPVGAFDLQVGSFAIESAYNNLSAGPLTLESSIDTSGSRVDSNVKLGLANFESDFGAAEITWHARLEAADGKALGNVATFFEKLANAATDPAGLDAIGTGTMELLANGLQLHFDRLEVQLPQGSLSSQLHLIVHESGADMDNWAAVILALDGTLELGLSQGLVDWLTAQFPEFGGAVALGYLRKSGDLYETLVEIRSGVLTINGAPMQIPLGAFQ